MINLIKKLARIIAIITMSVFFTPVIIGVIWAASIGGFEYLYVIQHKATIVFMIVIAISVLAAYVTEGIE